MVDDVRAAHRRVERLPIPEIADRELDAEALEESRIAAGQVLCEDGFAAGPENLGDMAPQEAGGAGDDVPFHEFLSFPDLA